MTDEKLNFDWTTNLMDRGLENRNVGSGFRKVRVNIGNSEIISDICPNWFEFESAHALYDPKLCND